MPLPALRLPLSLLGVLMPWVRPIVEGVTALRPFKGDSEWELGYDYVCLSWPYRSPLLGNLIFWALSCISACTPPMISLVIFLNGVWMISESGNEALKGFFATLAWCTNYEDCGVGKPFFSVEVQLPSVTSSTAGRSMWLGFFRIERCLVNFFAAGLGD